MFWFSKNIKHPSNNAYSRLLWNEIKIPFLIERWGFVLLWRLTAAVLCKKIVFEVLTSRESVEKVQIKRPTPYKFPLLPIFKYL
jgi:hypothetical protein